MSRRIYVVHPKAGGQPRLVRAAHPSNALRHVAQAEYTVKVATQDDIVDLVGKGAKVESIDAEQMPIDSP